MLLCREPARRQRPLRPMKSRLKISLPGGGVAARCGWVVTLWQRRGSEKTSATSQEGLPPRSWLATKRFGLSSTCSRLQTLHCVRRRGTRFAPCEVIRSTNCAPIELQRARSAATPSLSCSARRSKPRTVFLHQCCHPTRCTRPYRFPPHQRVHMQRSTRLRPRR